MSEKLTKDELWGDEAKVAERIIEWFDVFVKLRRLADVASAEVVIEQLRQADPMMMEGAQIWLHKMLMDRFSLEDTKIDRSIKAVNSASSKSCPYSAAQYDAAVAKVGTKQELLSDELNVSVKTLRKYGRPLSA